jgi:hypothetical protein
MPSSSAVAFVSRVACRDMSVVAIDRHDNMPETVIGGLVPLHDPDSDV